MDQHGDVDTLRGLESRGAHIRHAPANYPWGSRECKSVIWTSVLRFGADLRAGEPIGNWLGLGMKLGDRRGRRLAAGGLRRPISLATHSRRW